VRLVALFAALGLAVAAPASAKSLARAEACGLDGCVSFLNASELEGLIRSSSAGNVVDAPAVGPYYVVSYEYPGPSGAQHLYSFLYEPKSGLFATNGPEPGQLSWVRVGRGVRTAVYQEVAHFRPFPLRRTSWPQEIKSPGRLPMPDAAPQATPVAGAGTRDRTPDVIAALALALAAGGLLAARRLRIRRPKTA
jgi:hypothetical protein